MSRSIPPELLKHLNPNLTLDQAQLVATKLTAALTKFEVLDASISDEAYFNRVAHIVAQLGHESGFLSIKENLNYSAEGLLTTFPSRFSRTDAARYARNPQAIANKVYADRLGNGNEASGDGWKYCGRGIPQLTGRNNYISMMRLTGHNLVYNPDLLLQIGVSCDVTAAIFATYLGGKSLTIYMDRGGVEAVAHITKVYNGGHNGLKTRIALYLKAAAFLGVRKPPAFFWPVPVGDDKNDFNMNVGQFCDPSYYLELGSVHPAQDFNINRLKNEGPDKDLGHPYGAVADGVVESVSTHRVWGNITVIKHVDPIILEDFWGQYAHSDQVFVKVGDKVLGGKQAIGTIGKGGGERMPAHLHFEWRKYGPLMLPADFWPSQKYPSRADAEACCERNYEDPRRKGIDHCFSSPNLEFGDIRKKVTT